MSQTPSKDQPPLAGAPAELDDPRGIDGELGQSAPVTGEEVFDSQFKRPVARRTSSMPAIPKATIDPEGVDAKGRKVDLTDPAYYINRELSWLQFNARVLAQATDERTPLLERLKFLCISSTNLDEFFEVRVARLMEQVKLDAPKIGPDGLTPAEQLREIRDFLREFVTHQYHVLNDVLIPELAGQGIRFLRRAAWDKAQTDWIATYFRQEVAPVLSPLGLDPAHPFPRVLNKSLNFIVSLSGEDAFGRTSGLAVVQAPRSLPRLIALPKEVAGDGHNFAFLTSIIHKHVDELFPGMLVHGCYQFRVTRNSELLVDEEEVEDLMLALEDELYDRPYATAVRLEVADNCPMSAARFLLDHFELGEESLYQVNGPVNLNRLMMIPGEVDRADLKYPTFTPRPLVVSNPKGQVDMFELLREQPLLLHHPFESFAPVVEFIRQAAQDPQVLAIKQTLYRTVPESTMVSALIDAARAGKEVTVVIELRARFDEQTNIHLASRLQEAGAHVVYGVVGYKTHAKLALVVRREPGGIRRYVHLGTGNYHTKTAKLYTDLGLLSSDQVLGEDVHKVFHLLTGLGKVVKLQKILHAPFTLQQALIRDIEREREHAQAGRPARIMAKMNSLTETEVIRALYRASQGGVQIDLIVRGICRLRPGVKGLSKNIRVRSIVGRFLEHTRAYYFLNDGQEDLYCASADWMTRNLMRRVECAFPIEDPGLKRRVIHEAFEVYLRDNEQAWELGRDALYTRQAPAPGHDSFRAQLALIEQLSDPTQPIPAE